MLESWIKWSAVKTSHFLGLFEKLQLDVSRHFIAAPHRVEDKIQKCLFVADAEFGSYLDCRSESVTSSPF
jgi:hypothetical protein